MFSKKSPVMNRLLASMARSASPSSNRRNVFDFLNEPRVSAVAKNVTRLTRSFDPIVAEIDASRAWPKGYPDKDKGANALLFQYQLINTDQCDQRFDDVFAMYVEDALEQHETLVKEYPYLTKYFKQDPLGLVKYDHSDSNIFMNATKLVRGKRPKKGAAPDEDKLSEGWTSSEEDASKASATTPAKPSKPRQRIVPVYTKFTKSLFAIQLQLYRTLRASISQFMDKSTKTIVQHAIASHDTNNSLEGEKRIDPKHRYHWQSLRDLVHDECCRETTGGFYFHVFYTTWRTKGQLITDWLTSIERTLETLTRFSEDWGARAQRDAVTRLVAFFHDSDIDAIEAHLDKNPVTYRWAESGRKIRKFFRLTTLKDLGVIIRSIPLLKFAQNFDPNRDTVMHQRLWSPLYLNIMW